MNPIAASASGAHSAGHSADHVEEVYSKVGWRIMPLLLICYMISYLDRINIGYAQLQMKQTLTFFGKITIERIASDGRSVGL